MAKADPAFYELLIDTFDLVPNQTLYGGGQPRESAGRCRQSFVPHRFESTSGPSNRSPSSRPDWQSG